MPPTKDSNVNNIEDLFGDNTPYVHAPPTDSETSLQEDGLTFSVTFVSGENIEIRGEHFYIVALIKAVYKYMENNPDFTIADLTMTELKYWDGSKLIYLFKDTRFNLGIH